MKSSAAGALSGLPQANVTRAIPSMVDGFKPSQRKVLFGCFKRKLKNDCKVSGSLPKSRRSGCLEAR